MRNLAVGLSVFWFFGLGLSALIGSLTGRDGGPNGVRWWIRMNGRFLSWLSRRALWFFREVLAVAGEALINIATRVHNFFYARLPVGTRIFYGALLVFFLLLGYYFSRNLQLHP